MLAAAFDAKARRVRGEPVPLAEKMSGDASSGVAYAAVATDGTFVFVPEGTSGERRLVLTDRTGKARPVPGPPREYHYPRFSPDGTRLAVSIGPGHGHSDEVWICDIATGALTRLTFGDGNGNFYAVWSPDGKRVAYTTDRTHQGIFFKNADGSGAGGGAATRGGGRPPAGLVARRLAPSASTAIFPSRTSSRFP